MLKLTENAKKLLEDRYYQEGENWKGMWDRIFEYIVPKNELYRKEMYDMFINGEAILNTPTLVNAGVDDRTSLSACFVGNLVDDNIESMCNTFYEQAKITGAGGGFGIDLSKIRPKGSKVKKYKNLAIGVVDYLKVIDLWMSGLKQGHRNGAGMVSLHWKHPDILEFMKIKSTNESTINNFNISVKYDNDFFENFKNNPNKEVILEFKNDVVNIKKPSGLTYEEFINIHAKYAWKSGDPGILFRDKINEHLPKELKDVFGEIEATNPCFTGDTVIATTKGDFTIKELAENGEDIGVYSYDRHCDNILIKNGIHPRKTGVNKQIYKITLDDDSYIKATGNHEFLLTSGDEKKAINLVKGDSLVVGKIGKSHSKKVYKNHKKLIKYNTFKLYNKEYYKYKLLGDYKYGEDRNGVLYHKDTDSLNDHIDNLNLMDKQEYDKLHNYLMRGKNNQVFTKQQDNFKSRTLKLDEKNDRFNEITKTCEWCKKSYKINADFKEVSFCSSMCYDKYKKFNDSIKKKEVHYQIEKRDQEKYNKLLQQGVAFYKKYNKLLEVDYWNEVDREFIEAEIGWDNFKKSILDEICHNPKVVSIEKLGTEDVYNITVENTHVINCYSKKADGCVGGLVFSKNCGEEPLFSQQACNLGHINLVKCLSKDNMNGYYFNFNTFHDRVQLLTRMLDLIISKEQFPLKTQIDMANRTRNIGLGFTGFAETLVELNYIYGSDESFKFAETLAKKWKTYTIEASQNLGKEKGIPEINVNNQRNTILLTVAPTGSTSMLLGLDAGGIEPYFAVEYERKDHKGIKYKYSVMQNRFNQNLKVYKSSMEISYAKHIKMQSIFQKYCDAGISKTINLKNSATVDDVKKAYLLAYEFNCKGITVYRDGSKSFQVLTSGKKNEEQNVEFYKFWKDHQDGVVKKTVKLPTYYDMKGYVLYSEGKKWYVHVAFKDETKRKPFALFVQTNSKENNIDTHNAIYKLNKFAKNKGIPEKTIKDNIIKSNGQSNVEKIARTIGLLLRHNIAVFDVIIILDNLKEVPVTSFIFRIKKFLSQFIDDGSEVGDVCPNCGGKIIFKEGCLMCSDCGFSKC